MAYSSVRLPDTHIFFTTALRSVGKDPAVPFRVGSAFERGDDGPQGGRNWPPERQQVNARPSGGEIPTVGIVDGDDVLVREVTIVRFERSERRVETVGNRVVDSNDGPEFVVPETPGGPFVRILLSELPGDVVLDALRLGVLEHALGVVELNEFPPGEEDGGLIGDACSLLHVVGDDDHRELLG